MSLARKVALNTAGLVGARALVVTVGIATLALSARYLSLPEYGAFVAATAFVGLLDIFTDFGVFTMASREIARAPQDERRVVGNVLGLSFVAALLVGVLGWLVAAEVVYSGPEHATLRDALAIMLIGVLTAPVTGTGRAHFVAHQRAYLAAIGEVVSVLVTVTLMVLAVVLGWGLAGIVAAVVAGRFGQATVTVALMQPSVRFSLGGEVRYWRKLVAMSLPLGASRVIYTLYFRLGALLLALMATAEDVALYGLAFKFIEALVPLPGYLFITLFPEIARLDPRGLQVRNLVGQAVAVMEMAALAVLVLTVVFAEELVVLIGGAEFADAALALQLLAVGLAFSFVASIYGQALVAMGWQGRALRVAVVVLAVNVAANLALIPLVGPYGAAGAVAGSEIAAVLAVRRIYRGVAPLPENTRRARMVLAAGTMLIALAVKLLVPVDELPTVLLGTAAGLGAYIASLVALDALPRVIRVELLPMLGRLGRRPTGAQP